MTDDVHYFSNGTEGHMWMADHCDRCVHDHGMHTDAENDTGCDHLLNTLIHAYDPVFIRTSETVTRDDGTTFEWESWDCVEFSRCPCDRRDDPGVPLPVPSDPAQGVLFDASVLMPGVWRDIVLDELDSAQVRR